MVHDKRIPPGAWAERYDRVGEVLLQDVSLGPFEMAADARHGQLPRPEGGKDLRQVGHDHGPVPVDMRQTRFPVVGVALGLKIHPRGIGLEFERPGAHQESGVLAVNAFGNPSRIITAWAPANIVNTAAEGCLSDTTSVKSSVQFAPS